MPSIVYPAQPSVSDNILMPTKSNVVKYLTFPNWSNIYVMFDSGNKSPIVKSFNFWKSTTTRSFDFLDTLAFFNTTNKYVFH